MEPLKLHLSIPEQVNKLESRGLIIDDRNYAEHFLEKVNYYRFTGYLLDFRKKNSDDYIEDISFLQISGIYEFDAKKLITIM